MDILGLVMSWICEMGVFHCSYRLLVDIDPAATFERERDVKQWWGLMETTLRSWMEGKTEEMQKVFFS